MSRPLRRVLFSALIAGVAARYVLGLATGSMGDFLVYRQAGIAVQGPGSLYASVGLPFTYPPFAALVYTPFAGLSTGWARWLHTAVGAALLVWVLVALRRRLRVPLPLVVATALTMPFIRSLQLGQVNPLVFALLVTDWVVLSRRAGILTGLAAGLKVTPAAFGLVALLRRDWRAASAAALAFCVTVGLSALVRPQDTWAFWTSYLWDPMRVGGLGYADNQSLEGALLRLGVTGVGPYAVAAAVTLAVGLLAGWRQTRAGDRVGALISVGALGALVSPISWSHHWLWTPVFAWWLWRAGRRPAAVMVTAVASIAPVWTAERLIAVGVQPGLLYAVLTSPFVIIGLVSLVALCRRPGSTPTRERSSTSRAGEAIPISRAPLSHSTARSQSSPSSSRSSASSWWA